MIKQLITIAIAGTYLLSSCKGQTQSPITEAQSHRWTDPSLEAPYTLEEVLVDAQNISQSNIPPFKVEYLPFDDIENVDMPKSRQEMVVGLKRMLQDDLYYGLANPEKFSREVMSVADKLGCDSDCVSEADPMYLIRISSEIVGSKIDYLSVDFDKEFIERYGECCFAPDRYFDIGLGDCDKYQHLMIAAFDVLKASSKRQDVQNTYLTEDFGGAVLFHAWVTVVLQPSPDKIFLSYADPTFADNSSTLNADDHLDFRLIPSFVGELGWKTYANSIYAQTALDMLKDGTSVTNNDLMTDVLFEIAMNLKYGLDSPEKAAIVFENYMNIYSFNTTYKIDLAKYAAEEYFDAQSYDQSLRVSENALDSWFTDGEVSSLDALNHASFLFYASQSCFQLKNELCSNYYTSELKYLYPESIWLDIIKN